MIEAPSILLLEIFGAQNNTLEVLSQMCTYAMNSLLAALLWLKWVVESTSRYEQRHLGEKHHYVCRSKHVTATCTGMIVQDYTLYWSISFVCHTPIFLSLSTAQCKYSVITTDLAKWIPQSVACAKIRGYKSQSHLKSKGKAKGKTANESCEPIADILAIHNKSNNQVQQCSPKGAAHYYCITQFSIADQYGEPLNSARLQQIYGIVTAVWRFTMHTFSAWIHTVLLPRISGPEANDAKQNERSANASKPLWEGTAAANRASHKPDLKFIKGLA